MAMADLVIVAGIFNVTWHLGLFPGFLLLPGLLRDALGDGLRFRVLQGTPHFVIAAG